jgi:hypothetical protein
VFFYLLVFSCSVLLVNFAVSCVCVCLLAFPCCSFVSCCYLLSISCSVLNIGLLGSIVPSLMYKLFFVQFVYVVFF